MSWQACGGRPRGDGRVCVGFESVREGVVGNREGVERKRRRRGGGVDNTKEGEEEEEEEEEEDVESLEE